MLKRRQQILSEILRTERGTLQPPVLKEIHTLELLDKVLKQCKKDKKTENKPESSKRQKKKSNKNPSPVCMNDTTDEATEEQKYLQHAKNYVRENLLSCRAIIATPQKEEPKFEEEELGVAEEKVKFKCPKHFGQKIIDNRSDLERLHGILPYYRETNSPQHFFHPPRRMEDIEKKESRMQSDDEDNEVKEPGEEENEMITKNEEKKCEKKLSEKMLQLNPEKKVLIRFLRDIPLKLPTPPPRQKTHKFLEKMNENHIQFNLQTLNRRFQIKSRKLGFVGKVTIESKNPYMDYIKKELLIPSKGGKWSTRYPAGVFDKAREVITTTGGKLTMSKLNGKTKVYYYESLLPHPRGFITKPTHAWEGCFGKHPTDYCTEQAIQPQLYDEVLRRRSVGLILTRKHQNSPRT